jgi:hypothetical protein
MLLQYFLGFISFPTSFAKGGAVNAVGFCWTMSSAGRTAGFFSRLFKTKVHNEVSSSPVGLSDSSGTKRPTKLRIRAQYTMKDICTLRFLCLYKLLSTCGSSCRVLLHSLTASLEVWDMKHVRQPEPYRSILDFKDPDLINYFELFTDQSMGGSFRSKQHYFRILQTQFSFVMSSHFPTIQDHRLRRFFTPTPQVCFLRIVFAKSVPSCSRFDHRLTLCATALFEGNLVTELTDDMQDKGFVNIGYAAFKSVEISPPLDVDLYDAFQLKIRTDDRLYVAQIKSDSPYEEGTLSAARLFAFSPLIRAADMYQYVIPAPKESEINEWRDIFIPFDEFVLTSRGQIEDPQVPFDGRNTLHMGVLSAQRKSGPFRFEIEFWRAVRMEFIQSKKRYTLL